MQFAVRRLWRFGERGEQRGPGLFSLLFFLSFLKPFPSNPSTAAHIQRLAIIPIDPPHSPNGVWVSEGFSLCTWQPHVAGRLQGGGEGSAPWGQGLGMEWLWFIFHRAESKRGKCGLGGREENPPSLIKGSSLLSSGKLGWMLVVLEGEGRRGSKMKKGRQPSEMEWDPFFIPTQCF